MEVLTNVCVPQKFRICCDVCVHMQGGRSPLHWAASKDRAEMCRLLVEHGCSKNLKDNVCCSG